MMRIGLAIILGAVSACIFASDLYDSEGIGYSKASADACADALLYVKKQALVSSGAIIPSAEVVAEVNGKSPDKLERIDVSQMGDELVKVLSKEEVPRSDRRGNYICVVKAKLAVDADGVIKRNLAYKGKLPTWMVVPPSAPGRITIIAKARTLDGAVARALHMYAETLAGDHERVRYIEDLLEGKAEPYVRDTRITPEISVKWKRKYYMLGGNADPLFIHTFVEQTFFNQSGKVRHISDYREIESENGFASNFEDETGGETQGRLNINKGSATLKMLVESLKKSGFDVQYTQVTLGKRTEWCVLLVGDRQAKPA